jgi:CheY-like chemotaxis protein
MQAQVLLVEDNPVNQKLGRIVLTRLGLQVDIANNGLEALRLLPQRPYDLVFMDCQMPEMDGFEATTAIRSWEVSTGRPRVPIVAMTANAMAGDRERCLAAGMDDYIAKPIQSQRIVEALQRWIAHG